MKISYDKSADAFAIILKKGRVVKDIELAKNIFAGVNKKGEFLEIQILEISSFKEPWLTVEAAAKYLGRSERTILKWVKFGQLKTKKYGKQYKICPDDLEKMAS